MKNVSRSQRGNSQFTELRKKASNIINQLGDSHFDQADLDHQRLLEELNIYHIELELQHEELQNTRDKLEASQKYLDDLYEYAPIGYIVLGVDGIIEMPTVQRPITSKWRRKSSKARGYSPLSPTRA